MMITAIGWAHTESSVVDNAGMFMPGLSLPLCEAAQNTAEKVETVCALSRDLSDFTHF